MLRGGVETKNKDVCICVPPCFSGTTYRFTNKVGFFFLIFDSVTSETKVICLEGQAKCEDTGLHAERKPAAFNQSETSTRSLLLCKDFDLRIFCCDFHLEGNKLKVSGEEELQFISFLVVLYVFQVF